jgi:NADH:ubiquinone oxidoreductase subunit K
MSILALEATSLTLATIYMLSYSPLAEDYLGILILTFAAAETASALGLLATLSRYAGSDSINACSFSNFNSAPKAGYH